jgi:hypothetical protein
MGRWTPLILMAGGLAILLGTLLGTNFPLGGRSANNLIQPKNQESQVLPANITVNSTNGSASNPTTAVAPANTQLAQKPATEEKVASSESKEAITTAQNTQSASTKESGSTVPSLSADAGAPVSTSENPSNGASTNELPVRALW